MGTGIKLLIFSVMYFAVITAIFIYMPAGSFVLQGTGGLSDTPDFVDEVGGVQDSLSLIGFFFGLLTFNIVGLGPVTSIFAVYVPLIFFGLGLYGVIRGI